MPLLAAGERILPPMSVPLRCISTGHLQRVTALFLTNAKATAMQPDQGTLSARRATRSKMSTEWVDSDAIEVATRLQVHLPAD